jgi:hypothetical protein
MCTHNAIRVVRSVSRTSFGVPSKLLGVFNSEGHTCGCVLDVVSFPRFVLGAPPCKRGGFHSGFVLLNSSDAFNQKVSYFETPETFVSGASACLHACLLW